MEYETKQLVYNLIIFTQTKESGKTATHRVNMDLVHDCVCDDEFQSITFRMGFPTYEKKVVFKDVSEYNARRDYIFSFEKK